MVAHVVHALRIGGLENGLVNLINGTPLNRYRHAVLCLTSYDRFAQRITRSDTELFTLDKREGIDPSLYLRLWRILHRLKPDIVHTRNVATIEAQLPAALAGVRCRVHGEHGRDVSDLNGENPRYRLLRKACRPLIGQFIPLSSDLETYLHSDIGVPGHRITRIHNGVDTAKFRPPANGRVPLPLEGLRSDSVVIGTVGRMEAVKDPMNLVRAFLLLLSQRPEWRHRLRLVMIGGGSHYEQVRLALRHARSAHLAWLPGGREDVAEILPGLDLFVLPSLAEGISNTLLEAMSTGLPVVATRVGGNVEVVEDGLTGCVVPQSDPKALARALASYVESPERRKNHGRAGRARAIRAFSLEQMVANYLAVYDAVLARKRIPDPARGTTAERDY